MKLKITILCTCLSSISSLLMGQWVSENFLAKNYKLSFGYHPTIIDNTNAILCGNYSTDFINFTGKIFRTTNSGASFTEVLAAGDNFKDAYFINNTTGFAVGSSSTLIKLIIASTVNGGATWTTTLSDSLLDGQDVYFFDASNGVIGGDGGIIRTSNGGTTWKIVLKTSVVNQFSFPTPAIGYALAGGKLFKTTDAGNTWTEIYTYAVGGGVEGISFTSAAIGLITTQNGVLKTKDGGQTWIKVTLPEPANVYDVKLVTSSLGYLVGETALEAIIFKTTDGGDSWVKEQSTPNYLSNYGLDIKGNFALTCGPSGYSKNTNIASVQEAVYNYNIRIYPTVTSDEIRIKDLENHSAECYYSMYDVLGNLFKSSSFTESVAISLADVPGGVYVVNVRNKSGVLNQKIIKE